MFQKLSIITKIKLHYILVSCYTKIVQKHLLNAMTGDTPVLLQMKS